MLCTKIAQPNKMPHRDVLGGQSIVEELHNASGMQHFLEGLTRQQYEFAHPSSYEFNCQQIEEDCGKIFRCLSMYKKNGLRIHKNDGRDHPWVERLNKAVCVWY